MKYFRDSDTLIYDKEKCTGCGRCVEVCPHNVFKMENKRALPVNSDRCMECGACAKNCEFGALKVKAGVGCAAAIITGLINGTEPTCDCDPSGKCC